MLCKEPSQTHNSCCLTDWKYASFFPCFSFNKWEFCVYYLAVLFEGSLLFDLQNKTPFLLLNGCLFSSHLNM